MGTIKGRNGKDLTEAEEIKKRWRACPEELHHRSGERPVVAAQPGRRALPLKDSGGRCGTCCASPGSSGPPAFGRERALSHGNVNMMSSNESNCINILSPEVGDFLSECECRALGYT